MAVCQLRFASASALFRIVFLIFCMVYFTAPLHAGSMVSCHNFLSCVFCLNKWLRSDVSYFCCKSLTFLVDSLFTDATEAEKSRAALLALLEERIWIFGDIISEARLWNSSQSVSYSTRFKHSLVLTGWRILPLLVGDLSPGFSENELWKSDALMYHTVDITSTIRCVMRKILWSWDFEVRNNE
jgi:hypothetical protein